MHTLALEKVEELAKLERIKAVLDLSEDEYDSLDPEQKEDFDKLQHSQSIERRKE